MGFCRIFLALFVASVVAVSFMQSAAAFDLDPRDDPNHTCVYACNPKGQHGCRDNCPVCDPVQGRCVQRKCMATVTAKGGIYIREEATTRSAILGVAAANSTIELTGMVDGENYKGVDLWFKHGGGYVTGARLECERGGPSWCSIPRGRK